MPQKPTIRPNIGVFRGRALWHAGLLLASVNVCCLTLWHLYWDAIGEWGADSSLDETADQDISALLGDSPIRISPTPVNLPLPIERSSLARMAQIVAFLPDHEKEPEAEARSRLLQAARLSGLLRVGSMEWLERNDLGVVVRLGLPPKTFQNSWRGLEVVDKSTIERTEHRDQLLSALAEAHVPLSCQVDTPAGTATVRDLLRASLNEFHLNQDELSWTVIAYCLYLPPQSTWTNRLGERYDFDQVADTLVNRSLASESCRGIHLVGALTFLLHADSRCPILRESTRTTSIRYLEERVADAVRSQLSDGSWPLLWSAGWFDGEEPIGFTPKPTSARRLIVTGHLLEWFDYLPGDLKPPEKTMQNGLLWLSQQLSAMSGKQLTENFCACTHALRSLGLAISSR